MEKISNLQDDFQKFLEAMSPEELDNYYHEHIEEFYEESLDDMEEYDDSDYWIDYYKENPIEI